MSWRGNWWNGFITNVQQFEYDSKLQTLVPFLIEGIGIYWGSWKKSANIRNFSIWKSSGVSEEIDQKYSEFLQSSKKSQEFCLTSLTQPASCSTCEILSRIFYIPNEWCKLQDGAEIGLWSAKWLDSMFYTAVLRTTSDDYTRRLQRKTDKVGQTPNPLRIMFGHNPRDSKHSTKFVRKCSHRNRSKSKAETKKE